MRKIIGIIGYPLEHSISPAMHQAAFQKLGLDYDYIPFEVTPENLKEALTGLKALRVRGLNVTIPHKANVMPWLDEIDRAAQMIGAVNTIVKRTDRLIGYNTDVVGFQRTLIESEVEVKDRACARLLGLQHKARFTWIVDQIKCERVLGER